MYKTTINTSMLMIGLSFNALAANHDKSHFDAMLQNLDTQLATSTLAKIYEGYLYLQKQGQEKPYNYDRAPAPPLFYLEIKYVASADYPYWELIPDNAFATLNDHGGNWMYVVTDEGGYANPPSYSMTLNGNNLSLIQSDPIIGSGSVIIGFRNYWQTTSYATGGTAIYQATSINSPWNTETDTLVIR